jgi:hypothetical protein
MSGRQSFHDGGTSVPQIPPSRKFPVARKTDTISALLFIGTFRKWRVARAVAGGSTNRPQPAHVGPGSPRGG